MGDMVHTFRRAHLQDSKVFPVDLMTNELALGMLAGTETESNS